LFQLAIVDFVILNSTYERAIHLAFAITLLFLTMPFIKKPFKKNSGFAVGLKSGVKIIFDGLARGSKNMMSVALACGAAGIIIYL
jgi:TRAP-type uncharacterized transport system fused permease subunit